MLIRVNVGDLRAAVHVAAVCGKGRTPTEIASRLLISAHDGKCRIEATDHETRMQIAVNGAEIEEEGDALPIAKFLDRVLSVHPDDATAVLQTVGGYKHDPLQLAVLVGRSRVRLNCLPAEEWPGVQPPVDFRTEVDLPTGEIQDLIQSVLYAVAPKDNAKPALAGVRLVFTSVDGRQEILANATDGFRMASNKTTIETYLPIDGEITVPGALLRRLSSALSASGRMRISIEGAILRIVLDDDTVIVSPTIVDPYPSFAKILGAPGGKPTIQVAATFTGAKADLLAALGTLEQVIGSRTPLAIKVAAKGLKLYAANQGSCAGLLHVDGKMDVRSAKKLVPVGVPIHQLRDAVKTCGDEVEIVIPEMPAGPTIEVNTVGRPDHRQAIARTSLDKPLPEDRLPAEVDDGE